MDSLKRYDIINALIEKYGYTSYLEIGTQADVCMNEVVCKKKTGCDPKPAVRAHKYDFYKMSSDEFFRINRQTYDTIFIDGLHFCTQAFKDIYYSLKILKKGGVIVVHDCNPTSEDRQQIPVPDRLWTIRNGDVWKAWVAYRNNPSLSMFVIDADEGVGVMRYGSQKALGIRTKMVDLQYADLEANRREWLNLIEFNKDIL